jgi:hypothetical protein
MKTIPNEDQYEFNIYIFIIITFYNTNIETGILQKKKKKNKIIIIINEIAAKT